jgi:hypothetical protein
MHTVIPVLDARIHVPSRQDNTKLHGGGGNFVKITPAGFDSVIGNNRRQKMADDKTRTFDSKKTKHTTMATDDKTRTFSQKMLYFSQACDSFIYERFKTLGRMMHDYQWRFLFIPILLFIPMM